MNADEPTGEYWAPAVFLTIAVFLVYTFAVAVRFQIGSWPDSPVDWLPFDQGGHQVLLSFGHFAIGMAAIALLTVAIWTAVVLGRRFILRKSFPVRPLVVTWSLAAGFLLVGGAKILFWYLD